MRDGRMTRRDFFRRSLATGAVAYGLGQLGAHLGWEEEAEAAGGPTLVIANKSHDPVALVRAAVNGLGGMGRFVRKGARVAIKPNMGWARAAEQAANTNPRIVAEVVKMCLQAGAREVKVVDHPVDPPEEVRRLTGIEPAAKAAGARVLTAGNSPEMYSRVAIPRGKVLKSAEVLLDLQHADVIINLPIAKVHNGTVLTLAAKNLMGAVLNRGAWHSSSSLDQCIADFLTAVRPQLTILDAWRMLLTNGPKGPGRTKDQFTVAASTDPVAIDAFGASLLSQQPEHIGHIRLAHEMGLGEIDLKRVQMKYV